MYQSELLGHVFYAFSYVTGITLDMSRVLLHL